MANVQESPGAKLAKMYRKQDLSGRRRYWQETAKRHPVYFAYKHQSLACSTGPAFGQGRRRYRARTLASTESKASPRRDSTCQRAVGIIESVAVFIARLQFPGRAICICGGLGTYLTTTVPGGLWLGSMPSLMMGSSRFRGAFERLSEPRGASVAGDGFEQGARLRESLPPKTRDGMSDHCW